MAQRGGGGTKEEFLSCDHAHFGDAVREPFLKTLKKLRHNILNEHRSCDSVKQKLHIRDKLVKDH